MLRIFILLIIAFTFFNCEKELSIADFEDDFKFYQSELRIEAILDPGNFMNSVIRVDKTLLVTDTSLFNGIDENGDWTGFTDLNQNGIWDLNEPLNDDIGTGKYDKKGNIIGRGNGMPDSGEPHVDDFIEILPQIHDSTLTSVKLYTQANMNLVAEFEWKSAAGEFEYGYGQQYGPDSDYYTLYTYTYGGYKPKSIYSNVLITSGETYLFELITANGDVITGSTTPMGNPLFLYGGNTWEGDTMIVDTGHHPYSVDADTLFWFTEPGFEWSGIVGYEFVDSVETDKVASFIMPASEILENGRNKYIVPMNWFPLDRVKLKISVLGPNYRTYVTSELPIRDVKLSNLRDQQGNVVLGVAASMASVTIEFQFIPIPDWR